MYLASFPLAATGEVLRNGQTDLPAVIDAACARVEAAELTIEALLPETGRRARLLREAMLLQANFPDPARRPPLYGTLVGIKDLFGVDGFTTHAGSRLPPELFARPEAACVHTLRAAGALILGLTVAAEFAYFEPGPTRNPHNPAHTPGGSSSGAAAAVAAGYCQLALGTQTTGSIIRPAAYCGVVGFKPSYGRIETNGMILCSESLDTIGYMTQDLAGTQLVAPLLCASWQPVTPSPARPVLGIPTGPYLEQASREALQAFTHQLTLLKQAGYTLREVPMFQDIEAINHRHARLVCAEMARVHADWFGQYSVLYRPRTVQAIREGQTISYPEYDLYRASPRALRAEIEAAMDTARVDLWVSPAAPGPAPEGIESTGNPALNLPWTHAGMPALTLPAGYAQNGLPLGLQCATRFWHDENLLAWAGELAQALRQEDTPGLA